jgi:hypothetical protein
MLKPYLRVTGAPDSEEPDVDQLWLLIGTQDSCEGGRCFCLPPANQITSAEELIPACEQAIAAGFPTVTEDQIFEAWRYYRSGRRFSPPSPGDDPASSADHVTPIQFTVEPELSLVSYTVTGSIRMNDAKEFFDAILTHPDFRRGFNFIGDRRDMVTARADEYARAVAALVEQNRRRLAPCRWAVLVPNPVAFGMARMWSLMASETGVSIQPFYELTEAIEWLGLPPGSRPDLLKDQPRSRADTRW